MGFRVLLTGQPCQKMKHFLQVGAPARPASQLPKLRGPIFYLYVAGRVPPMAPRGASGVAGHRGGRDGFHHPQPPQSGPSDRKGRSQSPRLTLPPEFQALLWHSPPLPICLQLQWAPERGPGPGRLIWALPPRPLPPDFSGPGVTPQFTFPAMLSIFQRTNNTGHKTDFQSL